MGGHLAVGSRRKGSAGQAPEADEVIEQLERILADGDFDASPRSRAFLRFIVEETLAGRTEGLTQDAIASRVFRRREDFDPTLDPIVRIQAGRLRRSLERYYLLAGTQDLVRIDLPRGTYAPLLRWATPPEGSTRGKDAERPPASVDDWPTVVASVFEPATPDPDLEDTAARFLDDLAVEMGRYRDVRVVLRRGQDRPGTSPGDDARFALSGRFEEGGLRLVARLVDRRTGSHVWAEEYRCGSETPRAFQAETARVIAARVASEQGAVAKLLWAEQRERPHAALTPYGGILASYQFFFNRDPADLVPAIEALQRVVAAEPECGLAWVQLSRLYTANQAFEVAPLGTPIEQAIAYAQNGVRLDPSSQRARTALAGALLVKGELAASRAEVQSALDLNPDSLVYLEWIGWVMTMVGEWERGPDLVRRALSRNPHVIPVAHHALWLAHLRRGQIEEAYEAALQQRDPTFFQRAMMRACCLGHLGRREEAAEEVAELLVKKPDFPTRGRTLIGRLIKFPDLVERVVDGLGKAGLALD
jgi:tetratricopeptide (TPR) repeat protein